MVSKDQAIGWVICIVCVVIAVWYTLTLFFPQVLLGWLTAETVRFWMVAIPVFIAFVAVLAIGAWIGWTMATTPPPKPIEEIEAETEIEEKKEKEEEEEK